MATTDDIAYIRARCNRILFMLDVRSRPTFSLDPASDASGDATFPVTPAIQNNLDNKIATALNELKVRAAATTYP